jgi:hypothetical protein
MACTATSATADAPAPRNAPLEDWSALVTELTEKHGMSQREIATFCSCGQSAVSELARRVTTDPRHRIGEALKALRAAKRLQAAQKSVSPAAPAVCAPEGPTADTKG